MKIRQKYLVYMRFIIISYVTSRHALHRVGVLLPALPPCMACCAPTIIYSFLPTDRRYVEGLSISASHTHTHTHHAIKLVDARTTDCHTIVSRHLLLPYDTVPTYNPCIRPIHHPPSTILHALATTSAIMITSPHHHIPTHQHAYLPLYLSRCMLCSA